jgi:hypothetical protein
MLLSIAERFDVTTSGEEDSIQTGQKLRAGSFVEYSRDEDRHATSICNGARVRLGEFRDGLSVQVGGVVADDSDKRPHCRARNNKGAVACVLIFLLIELLLQPR